ncbi:hypothetical protein ACFX5Q_22725 [Mesorhizobium sp. IMUNJ 23033]|uniref:hypothetical protein n=1 Tax=Mesorhizobium sp. IMUNJ 23033 TaxID=3378039 RepID=UPI00384F5C76
MTMISDPDMPAIELGAQEVVAGKPSRKGTIGVVVAGAALVTIVNLTAAVYLYRGMNDLRVVEARLEQLGQFEQRIGARLDTINNGFQSRFEKLDSQLQSDFNEIDRNVARLEQNPPVAASDDSMSSAPEPTVVTTSTAEEAPAVAENMAEPDAIEMPRPPRKRTPAVAPPPNPAYQRIQQADGKVYYRKIN